MPSPCYFGSESLNGAAGGGRCAKDAPFLVSDPEGNVLNFCVDHRAAGQMMNSNLPVREAEDRRPPEPKP